ncbi:ribosome recycling factor, partial [Candidatus Dependentiae bacterium]|nr:ribosome recycling factor [Candidatus Dependentiae bacterium]
AKSAMDKPIKHFEKELAAMRTGRATTALLENIRVDCYGQIMPLRELATLAAPDARLLTIQPWDKSIIPAIENAIANSDLGATPANDGNIIRIQLQQMSSSRRDEMVKLLGKKTEECRVNVRNVRKDYHNIIREAEKKKTVSEDFAKRINDLLQKVTDQFIEKADQMHNKKEAELRQV